MLPIARTPSMTTRERRTLGRVRRDDQTDAVPIPVWPRMASDTAANAMMWLGVATAGEQHTMGPRLRSWAATVRAIVRATRDRAAGHDLMLLAAGVTLYAGIAIVPLLLLGLYGAGLVLSADRVATLVGDLAAFVPATMGAREIVRELAVAGPALGVGSLIASVIAATTYGEGMLRAVDALEGEQRGNRTLAGRIRVLPYVGVFPLVTVAGLLTVAALPDMLGGGAIGQVLGVYLTFWIGWLSATALLVVLYRLFAVRTLRWAATVWGALATGSFLAGMSLGWVLVLRYGVAVGQAFGGSEDVGRVVLFTAYLLLVQVTVLLGYLLVLSIDDHLSSPLPPTPPPSPHPEL
jgi:membrane protein